jgi:hypothetical protein
MEKLPEKDIFYNQLSKKKAIKCKKILMVYYGK